MKILKVLSKRCQGCLKPQKPSIYKGTEKGVLFTNERHAFFLCGKKPDSQWPGRKEPKLLARNYCHNSLHIYHNCGEICLQSHSNQALIAALITAFVIPYIIRCAGNGQARLRSIPAAKQTGILQLRRRLRRQHWPLC